MKIPIFLLIALIFNVFHTFGQDERYQFVQGDFIRGHITVHDQSTLEEGRVTEDYILLRNSVAVTTGAAKFLFMSASNEATFMIEFRVNGTMFSFKYDMGQIYKISDGQEVLVYDGGFSDSDVTHITFDNNSIAVMHNGVVLDQAAHFGPEVIIETRFTPLGEVPFYGEFLLTEQHIQPMVAVNFDATELWVEEGQSLDVLLSLTNTNLTGGNIAAHVELISNGDPHFSSSSWTANFPSSETKNASFVLQPDLADDDGTYVFHIMDVIGPSSRIGSQKQVIVHVIDKPSISEELEQVGDIRIVGLDNNIGGDADKLILTNLVPLAPGRTFQIVNGNYNNGIWTAGNHSDLSALELTYTGTEALPANSIICLDLNSEGAVISNIQINGETSDMIIADPVSSLPSGYLQIPYAEGGYLFLVDGYWVPLGDGYRLNGLVLDGLATGATWNVSGSSSNPSGIPPAIECTAIQGENTPGSTFSYYDCGVPFSDVPSEELNLDIADYQYWTSGTGGDGMDFPVDVCSPQCVECCDEASLSGDCCTLEVLTECRQVSVQWQLKEEGNDNWTDITGATSVTLDLSTMDPMLMNSQSQFRAIVADEKYGEACEVVITNTLTTNYTVHLTRQACELKAELIHGTDIISCPDVVHQWYEVLPDSSELPIDGDSDMVNIETGKSYKVDVSFDGGCRVSSSVASISIGEVTLTGEETGCQPYQPSPIIYEREGETDPLAVYIWEQSTNGIDWTEVSGFSMPNSVTSYAYNPPAINVTTHYRIRYGGDGCGDWLTSNVVTKTVYLPLVDAGTISGDQDFCLGETALDLIQNEVSASGGTGGIIQYRWQYREPGGSWLWLTASTEDYLPTDNSQSYQYRRMARRNDCEEWIASNVIIITVHEDGPISDPGSIEGDESRCVSYIPSLIESTAPAIGEQAGSIVYQWQVREGGGTWHDVSDNGNETSYQPGEIFITSAYRRRAKNPTCGDWLTSNVITKAVHNISAVTLSAPEDRYCSGGFVDITAIVSGEAPYNYQWSENLKGEDKIDIPNYDQATYRSEIEQDGVTNVVYAYIVTVSDSNGCIAMDTLDITIISLPEVTVSKTDGECGDNGSISFHFADHSGQSNIAFSLDGGTSYPINIADDISAHTQHDVTPGDYDLWARWGNDGCPVDLPDVRIETSTCLTTDAGEDRTICMGESTVLMATSELGEGSITYVWSNGVTGSEISVNPNSTTTYTVTATDANSNIAMDDVVVTVQSPPNADAGVDVSICSGSSVTLTAADCLDCTYQWSNGARSRTTTVSPSTSTNYAVTVTNSAGCSASDNVRVITQAAPDFNFIVSKTVTCGDEYVEFNYSNKLNCPTSTCDISYSPSPSPYTGRYQVTRDINASLTMTNTSTGCSTTASRFIDHKQSLGGLSISGGTITCGNSGTLRVTGARVPLRYLWHGGEVEGMTTSSVSVRPYSSTSYSVDVRAASNPSNYCSKTLSKTVSVRSRDISVNSASACEGESVTLTATQSFDSYSWSNSTQTGRSVTIRPTRNSSFTVTGISSNGNCRATASGQVEILDGRLSGSISGSLSMRCVNLVPTLEVSIAESSDDICCSGFYSFKFRLLENGRVISQNTVFNSNVQFSFGNPPLNARYNIEIYDVRKNGNCDTEYNARIFTDQITITESHLNCVRTAKPDASSQKN